MRVKGIWLCFRLGVLMRFERGCLFRGSRESAGCRSSRGWTCFNFLQTGKRMETQLFGEDTVSYQDGFNSLQTGKRMETVHFVSSSDGILQVFQFPSNGKAHGNLSK